ncbi:MAG: fatty-acyl-CoA synthase, partial [Cryptosporangiaceae bacterium]|nr:fatty-acyl-CoA synthase [Cryptosporangiaceae bacterium]
MRNQGIGSWPRRRARTSPGRVAIVHGDRELTYRELDERVTRLAHGLRTLGVRRGDRVAYLGPNHPAFLESLFATGALGAVFVPLNSRLAAPEIEYMLADSGAAVFVVAPECERVAKDVTTDATQLLIGAAYEALLDSTPTDPLDEPVGQDEPAMIMYTSGTTGRAKGATLTHANLVWNCVNVLVDIDIGADEVAL